MAKYFPIITAHSGSMGTQDHTLHSIDTGIQLGADVIEEDIRVTQDGVAVLAHDDEFRTAEGRDCQISQMTFEKIRELTSIVTLEDMLILVRESGVTANLDLKVDECIEPVADLVKKHGMQEQVFLSGCGAQRALKVQLTHPELRKLLNADDELFLMKTYSEAVAQTCHDALAASCFGINIHYQLVRQELMDAAAVAGLPVYVWTVNEETEMKQCIDLGVASITARNVLALVNLKEGMAK
ncbi:glycerophosphodiester phosphodiesterase [Paenibacillus sp. KQZ6P-2]|uniref:Glycerophosphodiester phosphodiesterase n=1 Tax=Paenibacillus mangrovi TaxID=2931978 RepID=A0A9X1WNG7_9BACL|nr:glycerophosphodiester phosphodiesterase [Paenibacillus mangrovi]MCJ8010250.1 glycerophosphodiester phosphodiesterase [Paenibacillus mangrovi]